MFFNLFKHKNKIYPIPNVGDRIVITDLPNPRNNPFTKSCYIGSLGIVDQTFDDGSFNLRYKNGGILIVGRKYKFITIRYS